MQRSIKRFYTYIFTFLHIYILFTYYIFTYLYLYLHLSSLYLYSCAPSGEGVRNEHPRCMIDYRFKKRVILN